MIDDENFWHGSFGSSRSNLLICFFVSVMKFSEKKEWVLALPEASCFFVSVKFSFVHTWKTANKYENIVENHVCTMWRELHGWGKQNWFIWNAPTYWVGTSTGIDDFDENQISMKTHAELDGFRTWHSALALNSIDAMKHRQMLFVTRIPTPPLFCCGKLRISLAFVVHANRTKTDN